MTNHRLKALLIVLLTCGLSLHAHAANGTKVSEENKSDTLKTATVSKLITFGIFTLKAVKKRPGDAKKKEVDLVD